MFGGRVKFLEGLTLVVLGCLTGFATSLCCDYYNPFATGNFGCKAYGSCNVFCCNCDDQCIIDGCDYVFGDKKNFTETDPEEIIANIFHCDKNSKIECEHKFTVEKYFEKSKNVTIGGGMAVSPFNGLISVHFSKYTTYTTVDRTSVGMEFTCSTPPGSKGWFTQAPKYATLEAKYINQCWSQAHGTVDHQTQPFKYRKPLVFPSSGFNVGDIYCRSLTENGESKRTKVNLKNNGALTRKKILTNEIIGM